MASPRPGPATGGPRLLRGEHRVVALDDAHDDSENAQGGGENFLEGSVHNAHHTTSAKLCSDQRRTYHDEDLHEQ